MPGRTKRSCSFNSYERVFNCWKLPGRWSDLSRHGQEKRSRHVQRHGREGSAIGEMQTNAGVNDQSVTLPTHDLDADNIKLFWQIQIAPFACRFNSPPRQNFDVYRPKLIPPLRNGTGRCQFKGHIRIKIQDHLPSRARCLHLGNPACKKPMPSEQSSQSIQLRPLQLQRQIAYPIGELFNRSVVDRPGFRRHLRAIINGSERGVYGKQAVHG